MPLRPVISVSAVLLSRRALRAEAIFESFMVDGWDAGKSYTSSKVVHRLMFTFS
jgi:hypothetical protein